MCAFNAIRTMIRLRCYKNRSRDVEKPKGGSRPVKHIVGLCIYKVTK